MHTYRIAVIAGDGIGPDVIAEGKKVLTGIAKMDGKFAVEFTDFPWGCAYYLQKGHMMPENGMDVLKDFDAIYLGAVGYPGVPDDVSLQGLLLKIRRGFDQYINLRPVKLLKGAPCPLKDIHEKDIDMIVVRENSEGEYANAGCRLYPGTPQEVALQTGVFSRKGCERVIRYAYELAKKEKKTLTNVSKANALGYSMVFWNEIFAEVGKEYPEVQTSSLMVDAASMFFVKAPARFQIVVTSNLFGDILTDLGAAIAGGMGLAAGANLNPERKFPSMFEPIHGSAPDIAGKGLANPLAAIWSVSQMLDFFGQEHWGTRVINAIETLLLEKKTLTPDLGGTAKTHDIGTAVLNILQRNQA
ncbi:MAG: tartrate dehydrogenase [Selenomonas sp.]|uniref:tartrate dehydrogenase n=1 Tax=Selenomonas sp. TaxID=2053611 RepID=UPI0025D0ECBC|nr:tartrate dehydrogenase [Selenomonas sp.]MCR5758645.1 tartrate dehydrogenase [Selenomonas sp.]